MPEKTTARARKRTTAPKPAVKPEREVGYDRIAERAYFISLDQGRGDDVANWLRAERELTAA